MNAASNEQQRRRLDRDYHDAIGSEYDEVIVHPRQSASDFLFDKLGLHSPPPPRIPGCSTAAAAPGMRLSASA
jgi:hypothetical protein